MRRVMKQIRTIFFFLNFIAKHFDSLGTRFQNTYVITYYSYIDEFIVGKMILLSFYYIHICVEKLNECTQKKKENDIKKKTKNECEFKFLSEYTFHNGRVERESRKKRQQI